MSTPVRYVKQKVTQKKIANVGVKTDGGKESKGLDKINQ
jgi:hypothetical protein